MRKTLFTALLVVISTYSGAQTSVTADILANTTWTPAGSPYIISGIVSVVESAQLTIQPGTRVLFTLNSGIDLVGKLYAVGTEQDTILFAASMVPAANDSWRGIRVIGTTDPLGTGNQIRMEYCKVMHAYLFTDFDLAYHGPYIFNRCHFTRNRQINHDGGLPYISYDHCKFSYNENALTFPQFDSYVSNSYFINNINGVEGFAHIDDCYFSGHTGIACSPYGEMNGCTIKNNAVGVRCMFNAVNNVFTNNIVRENGTGVEILSYFNGDETFTGNTICNNSEYNIKMNTFVAQNADLSENCWCTTNTTEIGNLIYDANDNSSQGLVNFTPLGSNCPQNPLGVDELAENPAEYLVYPNPFDQQVSFKSDQPDAFFVVLYDLANRRVAEQDGFNELTFDVGMLAQGVYLYEIRTAKGIAKTGKLVRR
jgi:hypothetical protein